MARASSMPDYSNLMDEYVSTLGDDRSTNETIKQHQHHLHNDGSYSSPSLKLSEIRLCGRSAECNQLVGSCLRVRRRGKSEVIVVRGKSGSGKTALVETLREPATSADMYFVSGKFEEQQKHAVPYSAIVTALSDLCDLLLQEPDREDLCRTLAEAVGVEDGALLARLVTSLDRCIPLADENVNELSVDDIRTEFVRIKSACKRMLRSFTKPLLICLDDVQWADDGSLDLIQSLMSDRGSTSMLLVCCYRTDDTSSKAVSDFFDSASQNETDAQSFHVIEIEHLGLSDLNMVLSDILMLPPTMTMTLCRVVHAKTDGSPFYALQFLEMLRSNGFLKWVRGRWMWDEKAVQGRTSVSSNVAQILTDRISNTPSATRGLLKLASFLGFQFDVALLNDLVLFEFVANKHNVECLSDFTNELSCDGVAEENMLEWIQTQLKQAVTAGFLLEMSGGRFRFSHDRIKEALYKAVPTARLAPEWIHVLIGRTLQRGFGGQEDIENVAVGDQEVVFGCADHLNRGAKCIQQEPDRVAAARANLWAARLARHKFSFKVSLGYLRAGVKVLDPDKGAYDKGLRDEMKAQLALTLLLTGDFVGCRNLCSDMMTTFSSDDRRFYLVREMLVESVLGERRPGEAANAACDYLREYGVRWPKRVSMLSCLRLFLQIRKQLDALDDDDILSRPSLQDEKLKAEAKLIDMAVRSSAYTQKNAFTLYGGLRLMRHLLDNGVSENSNAPSALALYAITCRIFADKLRMRLEEETSRVTRLALVLADRFSARVSRASTRQRVYFIVMHWQQPVRSCLAPLLVSQDILLSAGELQPSLLGFFGILASMCLMGIRPLSKVCDYCESTESKIERSFGNQERVALVLRPFWQVAENLMRVQDDPALLSAESNEEAFAMSASSNNEVAAMRSIFQIAKLQLLCAFDVYTEAAKLLKEIKRSLPVVGAVSFVGYAIKFLAGITYMRLYRDTGRKTFLRKSRKYLNQLERLEARGCPNVVPMCCLLRAEMATLSSRTARSEVSRLFSVAVDSARTLGFMNHEALGYERAAQHFARSPDTMEMARIWFVSGVQCYKKWEAEAKVVHFVRYMPFSFQSSQTDTASLSQAVPE